MSVQAGLLALSARPIGEEELTPLRAALADIDADDRATLAAPWYGMGAAIQAFDDRSRREAQPQVGRSGALVTFDGRLDNRGQLITLLGGGHWQDAGDAELALGLFEREGVSGWSRLIGDWSLALIDPLQRRTVLASDHAGVRPLYYGVEPDRLYWSSRLEHLVEWTGIDALDPDHLAGLLLFRGLPNHTPYSGLRSVPPGCAVCISPRGTRVQRLWQVPTEGAIRYRDERDYEAQLRELFRESVAVRLRSDRPVLAELSGGLDSSSIVCQAQRLLQERAVTAPALHTLSLLHPGSLDEPFILEVEQLLGATGEHLWAPDYPLMSENYLGGIQPQFMQALHTREAHLAQQLGARVYLTGLVGDDVMANHWDDSDQVAGYLRKLRLLAACKEALPWATQLRTPIWPILWRSLQLCLPPTRVPPSVYRHTDMFAETPEATADSLTPACRERAGVALQGGHLSPFWMQAPPERRRHLRTLTEWLELRSLQAKQPLQDLYWTHPYTHRPLLEFMYTIPMEVACRPDEPRRLMRRALRDLWPPKLQRRRSKDPFTLEVHGALRPLAVKMLGDSEHFLVVELGYVDRDSLMRRLRRLTQSLECNIHQLRNIILMELWLRRRSQPPTVCEKRVVNSR